jgi:hypothetical protein
MGGTRQFSGTPLISIRDDQSCEEWRGLQGSAVIAPPLRAPPAGGSSSRRPSHAHSSCCPSDKGVRSAQKMQVGPCIPVGMQLEKAEVGPTSGPTANLASSPLLRPARLQSLIRGGGGCARAGYCGAHVRLPKPEVRGDVAGAGLAVDLTAVALDLLRRKRA